MEQADNNSRRKLYDALSQTYNLGSFDEFNTKMDSPESRQKLYNAVSGTHNLGSFSDFEQKIGSAQPASDPPQPVSTHPAQQRRVAKPTVGMPQWKTSAMPEGVRQRNERQEKQPAERAGMPGDKGVFANPFDFSSKPQEEINKRATRDEVEAAVPKVYAPEARSRYVDKLVEEYSPELGTAADWKRRQEDAKKAQREHVAEQLDNMLGDVENMRTERLKELGRDYQSKGKRSVFDIYNIANTPGTVRSTTANQDQQAAMNDEQLGMMTAAERKLKGLQKTVEEAQRHADDPNWFSEFGRGMGAGLSDVSTWDFGITDLADAKKIQRALEKYDRISEVEANGGTTDEVMTPAEQALLDAVAAEVVVNEYYGSDLSNWYKGGQSTAVSIPFMASMIVSPAMAAGRGASAAMARYITKRFAQTAAKKGIQKVASKVAQGALKASSRVAIDAGAAALHTAMFSPASIEADTRERMRGQITPTYDAEGNVRYGGRIGGDSEAEARRNAAINAFIENESEMLGDYIPGMKIIFGNAKWAKRFMANRFVNNIARMERRAQFHGFLPEVLEEIAGGAMNAAWVGDQTFDADPETGVFSKDNLSTIAISIGATTLAMGCAKLGGYAASRAMLSATNKEASQLFGDEWNDIRERLQSEDMNEVSAAAEEIRTSDKYTEEQKKAAIKYATLYTGLNAYEHLTADNMDIDAKNANDTYRSAYDDATSDEIRHDITIMMDESREKVRQTLGDEILSMLEEEDPLTVKQTLEETQQLTDEQAAALADYVAAHSAVVGVKQRIEDDADAMVERERDAFNLQRNDEDGALHPATMTVDGKEREVYIKSGNVVLDASGAIDVANSGETIVVYDPVEGKNVMVSPKDLGNVGEVVTAEQYEAGMQAQREAYVQQQQDAATGRFNPQPGQQIEIPEAGTATVLATDGESVTLQMPDGSQQSMSIADIQSIVDAMSMEDYRQRHPESAAPAADEGQPGGLRKGVPEAFEPDMDVLINEDGQDKVLRYIGRARLVDAKGKVYEPDEEGSFLAFYDPTAVDQARYVNTKYKEEYDAFLQKVVGYKPAEQEEVEQPAEPAVQVEQPEEAPVEEQQGESVQQEAEQPAEPNTMPMRTVTTGKGKDKKTETVPDWYAVTPERAHTYIYNELGFTPEIADATVKANADETANAIAGHKKNEPMPTANPLSYKEAHDAWQKDLEFLQQQQDYWKQVQAIRNQQMLAEQEAKDAAEREERERRRAETEAARQREREAYEAEMARRRLEQEEAAKKAEKRINAMAEVKAMLPEAEEMSPRIAEVMRQVTPARKIAKAKEIYGDYFDDNFDYARDAMELVAMNMPKGDKRVSWEDVDGQPGLQTELGGNYTYSRGVNGDSDLNGFGMYIAKKGEGISFADAANTIYNSGMNWPLGESHPRFEEDEIKDAMIEHFSTAESQGDISGYVLRSRLEQAEDLKRAEEVEAINQEIRMVYDMGPAEYEAWMEYMQEKADAVAGMTENEYVNNIILKDNDGRTETGAGELPAETAGESGDDARGGEAGVETVRREESVAAGDEADGARGNEEVDGEPADAAGGAVAAQIEAARAAVDTHPTEGQKKAGNYPMGHLVLDGYDITLENPKGSVRSGVDADGKAWSQEMHNDYGYIRGTEGVDGDHIDVFLSDDPTQGSVFVVDQVNADGNFDEHKVMYGFPDAEGARQAYLSNYEEGWQGLGTITEVSKDEFKKWIDSSHRKTKPFAEYKNVKVEGAQNERQPSTADYRQQAEKSIADILDGVERGGSGPVVSPEMTDAIQKIADMEAEAEERLEDNTLSGEERARVQAQYDAANKWMEEHVRSQKGDGKVQKPTKEQKVMVRSLVDLLNEMGVPAHLTVKEGQAVLDKYREMVRALRAYHGSGADFEQFESSHIGEGMGVQRHGHGFYVTTQQGRAKGYAQDIAHNKTHYLYKGEEIPLQNNAIYKAAEIMTDSSIKTKRDAIEEAEYEKSRIFPENESRIKLWDEIIDIIKNSKKNDFTISRESPIVYEVEIPEDNGNNYIDWTATIPKSDRKRIAEAVRAIPEERLTREKHGNNWLPGGFGQLANMIEKNAWGGMDIYDRLYDATGSTKLTSDLLSGLGYKGVRVHEWSMPDGEYTYVIFNDNDLKIVDKIRFHKAEDGEYVPEMKPVFYSNAMKAVEGIKQEKATPEQWLKMIEKAGGLKAGEDKWTGLSEWLRGLTPNPSPNGEGSAKPRILTKQEVMDYLRENAIEVEEVEYSEDTIKALQEEYDKLVEENGGDRGAAWSEMNKRYRDERDIYLEDYVNNYNGELSTVEGREYGFKKLGLPKPINKTRQRYTTDFLDNKREIALVVPSIEPWNEGDEIHFGDAGEGRAVAWVRFGETTTIDAPEDIRKQAKDALKAVKDYQDEMREKYRGDYGVMPDDEKAKYDQLVEEFRVAKERERNAGHPKRVLVIDEIQSKRHQEGREKGYKKDIEKAKKEFEEAFNKQIAFTNAMKDKYGKAWYANATEDELDKFNDINRDVTNLAIVAQNDGIPDAPFEKNWHEVAMKRMLRYAAENGYDKVAWTTGEQQAERYDLSKSIKDMTATGWTDYSALRGDEAKEAKLIAINTIDGGEYAQLLVDKNGKVLSDVDDQFVGRQLSDIVGKDLAKRLMEDGYQTIEGDGLRIGGEGMKGFYDQILPRFMDKYGKKWGVKTTDINLPNIGDNGLTMHSVDVTPEMKADVMEGQPMFFKTPEGEVYGFTLGGEIYIDPRYAKPETPVHEYTHLWAQALRDSNPTAWARLKEEMRGVDGGRQWDYVQRRYPELKNEDELVEEVFAHYGGKRGGERLEGDMREEMKKANGIFEKAHVANIFHKLRRLLQRFWKMARDLFAGKVEGVEKMTAEDFADMALGDLMRGYKPEEVKKADAIKAEMAEIERKAKADGTWMKAPNGNQSNLNERQWVQVRTKAFKDWFGDWENDPENASKVVDENGEPLVVYHGTTKDFTIFDKKKIGKSNYGRYGFFFTPDESLSIDFTKYSWVNPESKLKKGSHIISTYLNVKNPLFVTARDYSFNRVDNMDLSNYDGVIITPFTKEEKETWDRIFGGVKSGSKEFDYNQYVVFEPNQIKSATGNIGTFDSGNADIRYQKSGTYTTRDGVQLSMMSLFEEGEESGKREVESGKPDAGDLSELRLRKLAPGETCLVERRYEENKQFSFTGSEKIESMDDVAYIFKQLEDAAVENVFLALVKDGKPTVIHIGMGTYAQSSLDFRLAFAAYKDIHPDAVYVVHNHPSGALKASKEDRNMLYNAKMYFGNDVVKDGIIIDTVSGKYGVFGFVGERENAMPESADHEVSVKTYEFSKQVFNEDWNPEEATKFADSSDIAAFIISQRLGEHPKMSFIVVNNQYQVVGNYFLPWTSISEIDDFKAAADELSNYVQLSGGTRGILYGNYQYDNADKRNLQKLAAGMKSVGTPLSDVLHIDIHDELGYHSAHDSEELTPEKEYEAPKREAGEDYLSYAKRIVEDRNAYEAIVKAYEAFNSGVAEAQVNDPGVEEILNDGRMGMREKITATAIKMANEQKDNMELRNAAVRAIGGNLMDIRKAMSLQREYDKGTVKRVADLARVLVKGGYLEGATNGEMSRILSIVKNATGKSDITGDIRKLMEIMVDSQLRRAENMLSDVESIKGSKVDSKGVEVQGKLDVAGQQVMKTFKETRGDKEEDLSQDIAEAENRMLSDDAAVAEEATNVRAGLLLSLYYQQNIRSSKTEERKLREELDDARHATDRSLEFENTILESIQQNRVERLEAYNELMNMLGETLQKSIDAAKEFTEADKERVREIQHNANSDMAGRPAKEHYKPKWKDKMANNSFVQFFFKPLATFDQMLRLFGSKSANGEGYLYNRFMRGWVDAREKEIRGVRGKYAVLDEKVKSLFGNEAKNMAGLIRLIDKMPKATVLFKNGGELIEHQLTQGNLMYIYMVNKMLDGRMKLRKMGIDEKAINEVMRILDPRLMELADWMQEEFLVDSRNEYNETHKRIFGAPMAAIEHYFPLKINPNARVDKAEDLDDFYKNEGISTKTGSIIKRRRNALALDILNADALNVILDHVAKMEHWNAFAEFNRDLNTLRTYAHFRNQVKNMTTIYGSGDKLWEKFNDLCQMAAGTYRPKRADLDVAATNLAKGVTAAKVSFRIFTALKQFLSMPAYLPDARPDLWAKNLTTPWKSWSWAMENLPIFEERWKSRMAGDPRLLKSELDWKGWRNNIVQMASKIGMSPNAFVDALTVSIGAKTIYESRKARYLKEGYSEEQAERKAKQDAEIAYNQTQQSSEGAFLSTMQVDRSWLSVMFTVFRNSSMAYQRQLHDALRNLKRDLKKGNRAESIEFMTKQMVRDGVDEEQAKEAATARYDRQVGKDALRVATFGFILQFCWNLGAYLPYLLFGDDDDKKSDMWDDIFAKSMFGWGEGLTGGDVFSEAGKMAVKGEGNPEYLKKEMPAESDVGDILKEFGTKKYHEAITDIINLVVQAGIGVNPQSITDAVLAIMDACGNDPDLAKESLILYMRILQVPQSQIRELYLDEIGMTGEEASKLTPEQLAERYAKYQVKRGRFFQPWEWNNENDIKREKKNATKKIKERVDAIGGLKVNKAYEQYEEQYKDYDAKVKEYQASSEYKDANYNEQHQWINEMHMEDKKRYITYMLFPPMDKTLDQMAKYYLSSTTPRQAQTCHKYMEEYKQAMIDRLDAADNKEQRDSTMAQVDSVLTHFRNEFSNIQPTTTQGQNVTNKINDLKWEIKVANGQAIGIINQYEKK